MFRRWLNIVLTISLIGSSFFALTGGASPAAARAASVSVPTAPIPEANDFATVEFGDAWDMTEFSDISQYLNGAGRHVTLTGIQVKDGVFSASSLGDRNGNLAFFTPLHEGYANFMQIGGNLGSLEAIDPGSYQCFYIAMKANSQYKVGSELGDGFRVSWSSGATNGGTNQVYFYPETVRMKEPIVQNWRLYKVDLRNAPNGTHDTPWTSQAWRGLQINPTLYKNIPFAIDWLRLTNCNSDSSYQARITWNPDRNLNAIWANPVGTDRNILLAGGSFSNQVENSFPGGVDGSKGAYDLDTKGLAPGSYRIGVGTLSSCCSQWSDGVLKINQAPVIKFLKPSPYSGEDYASSGGNAWDMDPSDFTRIDCVQASFGDGLLRLDTPNPAALPRNCKGPSIGEADPQLFLNLPTPLIVAGDYRYLSFRMYINGDYPVPADGMIGRWMWTNTNDCTRVSADIPYDVGWHTYTIDLYDAFNGKPVEADRCDLKPWREAGQVIRLRFDPNENWTGNNVPEMVFHQEFDWIRLTKVERVARGTTFPIQIVPNKPINAIPSISFFYTNNRQSPTENLAAGTISGAASPETETAENAGLKANQPDQQNIYLPVVGKNSGSSSTVPGGITFNWSTSDVPPGEYYICAKADDGINQTTYCSDAPLQVY